MSLTKTGTGASTGDIQSLNLPNFEVYLSSAMSELDLCKRHAPFADAEDTSEAATGISSTESQQSEPNRRTAKGYLKHEVFFFDDGFCYLLVSRSKF